MFSNHLYLKYQNFTLLCAFYVLICFLIISSQGLKCGKYGFVCINDKYFKKCDDKFVRELPKEVIFKCPKNTICNERFKRACDMHAINDTTNHLQLMDTTTELSPREEEELTDVIKADIKDMKSSNMSAKTAKLSHPIKSDKIEGKSDEKSACPTKTRVKRFYFCPTEGAFVDRENDRNFYICYKDRKSNNKLRAVPLQCPDGMIFDPKSQKCVQPSKLMIYKFPHKRKYIKYS